MRVCNNAETRKQSGRNCSKHQQCDRKDVRNICFENKSNLKQYLVDNLAQKLLTLQRKYNISCYPNTGSLIS